MGVGVRGRAILYDAWGNERERIGSSANKFTFTGHEKDEETGLIYAKARFYDPDVGRFLTQDSFLGEVMAPPSLNRFMYAEQNPLRFIDPEGLQAQQVGEEERWKTLEEEARRFQQEGLGAVVVSESYEPHWTERWTEKGIRAVKIGWNMFWDTVGHSTAAIGQTVQGYYEDVQGVHDERVFTTTQTDNITALELSYSDYPDEFREGYLEDVRLGEQTLGQKASGEFAEIGGKGTELGVRVVLEAETGRAVSLGFGTFASKLKGADVVDDVVPRAPGRTAQAVGGSPSRWVKRTTPWQRRVYQRGDINWSAVRPEGTSLAGKTNWEAAAQGYAPGRINPRTGKWEDVVLHHANQDPRGAVAEMWRSTHGKVPHQMDPPGAWRKSNPTWAEAWRRETSAYWRWRTGEYNPAPTDKLRLPGDK